MPDIDKPVLIITTIHPAKKHHRPITVSAAPAGEIPILLAGQFADRHALLDQVFATLLQRNPKVVRVGAQHTAPAGAKNVGAQPAAGAKNVVARYVAPAEAPETVTSASRLLAEADQSVRSDEAGANTAGLPAIEGDEAAAETQSPLF